MSLPRSKSHAQKKQVHRQIQRALVKRPRGRKRQLDQATPAAESPLSDQDIADEAKRQDKIDASNWTNAKGDRRAELVDKDLDATLTAEERLELEELTRLMRAYRRVFAPLPIEAMRALHAALLRDIEESK